MTSKSSVAAPSRKPDPADLLKALTTIAFFWLGSHENTDHTQDGATLTDAFPQSWVKPTNPTWKLTQRSDQAPDEATSLPNFNYF